MKDASSPGQFCQSRMGKCVVPDGQGSRQPFLLHYLLCRAMPCLAESSRRGSLAPLLAEVVNTSHQAKLESSLSWSPHALGFPLSTFVWLLNSSSEAFKGTFPLTKQIGLSGISSLRVWFCAFMGMCGFPWTGAPLLCFAFPGVRS